MCATNSGERKLTELDFIRLKKFTAAGTFPQLERSTAWEDFFCASVAHRVLILRPSALVVPDACLQATAPLAARHVAKVVGNKSALPLQPAERRA